MATGAELGYDTRASAVEMANTIFGNGVTVVGASYQGDRNSAAIYTNGDALSVDLGLGLFDAGLDRLLVNLYDAGGPTRRRS